MPIVTKYHPDYTDTTVSFTFKQTGPLGESESSYENQSQLDRSTYIEKDVTRRDWKRIIREGGSATTYLLVDSNKTEFTIGYGSATVETYGIQSNFDDNGTFLFDSRGGLDTSSTYTVHGGLMQPGANPAPSADLVKADDLALENFYQKMRAAQSSFQGGVFLAELKEAIHGIRHPAEAVSKFLQGHILHLSKRRTALKSAIRSKSKSTVKSLTGGSSMSYPTALSQMIAKSWLEAQYHWIPLVSDMQSAGESLAAFGERSHPTKRVRATGTDAVLGDDSEVHVTTYAPFGYKYKRTAEHRFDVRYYGAVKIQTPDVGNVFHATAQAFGLNMSNFIPTLYNAIPFTFVLDYFSNLGGLVDAMSFPTSSIAWAARTNMERTMEFCHSASIDPPPESGEYVQWKLDIDPGRLRIYRKQLRRDAIEPGNVALPNLRYKVPGVSSKKWLNLAALGTALANFSSSH